MHILEKKIHIPANILRWYCVVLGIGAKDISNDELNRLSEDGIDGFEDLLQLDVFKSLPQDTLRLADELYKAIDSIYNDNNKNDEISDDDDRELYMKSYIYLLHRATQIKLIPENEDSIRKLEQEGVNVDELFRKRCTQVSLLACRDINKLDFASRIFFARDLKESGERCLANLSSGCLNLRSLIKLSFMSEDNDILGEKDDRDDKLLFPIFNDDKSHIVDTDKLHSFWEKRSSKVIEFNPSRADNLGEGLIGIILDTLGSMDPEVERFISIPIDRMQEVLANLSSLAAGLKKGSGAVRIRFLDENIKPDVRLEFNEVEGKVVVYENEKLLTMVDVCPKPWTREYFETLIYAEKRGIRRVRVRNIKDFSGCRQDN